jgi:ElaA protein
MEKINWTVKAFHDLTVEEYFEILYLRVQVFVVEQDCPYQEVDQKDKKALHVFGTTEKGEFVAVSRVLAQNISYPEISIGRVALKEGFRGMGIGDVLMAESLKFVEKQFGKQNIRISAQEYLLKYYQKHGFEQVGEGYLEDDIPHIEMLFECKK